MLNPGFRERAVSEEYADLIMEYFGDYSVFDQFENAEVYPVGGVYAIVHIPIEQFNNNIIIDLSYSVVPKVYGVLSMESLEASGIQRIRSISKYNLRGQGVIIGFIDTGIDYTNPIFQYADGTTRIIEIWDQTIQSDNFQQDCGYGTVYTRDEINLALQSEDPLDIVPSIDENGHGTMVAGIAAGNEVPESDFFGVAPDAEIVVVKLKQAKQFVRDFLFIPEGVDCFQNTDILFASRYLLDLSNRMNRPIVMCYSVGSSQGSHEGLEIISIVASAQSTKPGIGIIAAAGNEGNSRRHYHGFVDPATGLDLVELNVGENVGGFSMELWAPAPSLFSIDIQTPSGEYVGEISAGRNEHRVITFVFELTVIYIDFQIVEQQSGNQLILMRFDKPAPGIWRFNIYERGDLNLGFDIWLPMGRFLSEDTFFIRSDPFTTILNPGNAIGLVTATAYNDSDDSLYINSSRGYNRLGYVKPEVAAPGVNVTGPDLNQGFIPYTGTSVAAAHTTGVAAMLMEWAIVQGNLPSMSTIEMKKLMIRGARRDTDLIYPNRDWGYGILDIYNIYDRLRTEIVI